MTLKAGTSRKNTSDDTRGNKFKTTYKDSMAEAMEKAFIKEWPKIIEDQPVPAPSDQMRLLFIAIAQGVVWHLKKKPGSFKITIDNHPEHHHTFTNAEGEESSTRNMESLHHNIEVAIDHDETLYDLE